MSDTYNPSPLGLYPITLTLYEYHLFTLMFDPQHRIPSTSRYTLNNLKDLGGAHYFPGVCQELVNHLFLTRQDWQSALINHNLADLLPDCNRLLDAFAALIPPYPWERLPDPQYPIP